MSKLNNTDAFLQSLTSYFPGIFFLNNLDSDTIFMSQQLRNIADTDESTILCDQIFSKESTNSYNEVKKDLAKQPGVQSSCKLNLYRKDFELSFSFNQIPELNCIIGQETSFSGNDKLTLNYLLDWLPGHIYIKDLKGTFLTCNQNQARDIGLSSRYDLIGKTTVDAIWSEQPEAERIKQANEIDKIDRQVIESNKPLIVEEPLVSEEGEKIFLSHKIPMFSGKQAIGIMGLSLDVTELKDAKTGLEAALARLEIANETSQQFIALLDSELRAKLNNILSGLHLLMQETQSDSQGDVAAIAEEAETIMPLVSNLHKFVSTSQDYKENVRETFTLLPIVEDVLASIEACVRKNKRVICFDDVSLKSISIRGWSEKLRILLEQIITEVVSKSKNKEIFIYASENNSDVDLIVSNFCNFRKNSNIPINNSIAEENFCFRFCKGVLKLMQADSEIHGDFTNGVHIKVSLKKDSAETEMVSREPIARLLQDYSENISAFIPEPIFTYLKGNYCTKDIAEVKKIEFMEQIYNKEKVIFTLSVFFKNLVNANLIHNSKILIVEDNALSKRFMTRAISEFVSNVKIVETAEEAIDLVDEHTDLVFMDIGLPGMSGIDAMNAISEKLKSPPPVVAITAHASEKDIESYFAAGMEDVILKPIAKDELFSKLKAIITR